MTQTVELLIAGVDEAGRGPLAGPVMAAAVILNPHNPIEGLRDSKKLSASQRAKLAIEIKEKSIAWAVARAEVEEIDSINILQASLLAMRRAVMALSIVPHHVQIDGNRCPALPYSMEAIIGGDDLIPAISAASILAKETRDQEMLILHQQYPAYAFDQHKGYPTKLHLAALETEGVTPHHRKSFGPVKRLLLTAVSGTFV
jgi:ribonuclease HII